MTPLYLKDKVQKIIKEIKMKQILALAFIILLTSCSSLKTDVASREEINFSDYKTMSWVDMKGKLSIYHLSGVMDERVKQGIKDGFEKKGLKVVEGNESDLIINYLIKGERDMESRSFNVSFGYHPYSNGMIGTYNTMTFTSSREYESGALMIDLVDRKTNQLVWRGRAKKAFPERTNPHDKLNAFYKIVDVLTKDFPPTK